MNITQRYAALVGAAAIAAASLAMSVPAMAQTTSNAAPGAGANSAWHGRTGAPGMMHGTPPVAFGSVTAVSGTTLTVQSRAFGNTATTTYTVDASNATVRKNNATSTVSAIAVGDFVMVQGTKSGTGITATSIRDGMMMRPGGTKGPGGNSGNTPSPIQGNGQPVVAGTVSAVNGSSLTVSTKSNVTYAVDASNAKVLVGNSAGSLSSVSTGDSVIVQGAVNGTSVAASTIIDQKAPAAGSSSNGAQQAHGGFLSSIGQFFKHLFGF